MRAFLRNMRDMLQYPSAIIGSVMVLMLVILSIYTLITIPYNQAIILWRGGEDQWYRNPKLAMPTWTNYFRKDKLPESIALSTAEHPEFKTVEANADGSSMIFIEIPFEYNFDVFPDDLSIVFKSQFCREVTICIGIIGHTKWG